ncbi:MAG: helix-turn-helix domain-containing protein [Eisenbergiella sp.]
MEKGDAGKAVSLFHGLLQRQKEYGCTASAVRNSGMSLQERCRKLLTEGETDERSRQGRPGGIAHQIYGCVYLEEYSLLMESLLKNTAQAMKGAAQGKESLINACLRCIDRPTGKPFRPDITDRIVNTSYLSRIFREETGNTIIHTINEKKLSRAREYLVQTDMKIYEIAEILGFENVTYFSHFFKKHTGLSPKDYKDKTEYNQK